MTQIDNILFEPQPEATIQEFNKTKTLTIRDARVELAQKLRDSLLKQEGCIIDEAGGGVVGSTCDCFVFISDRRGPTNHGPAEADVVFPPFPPDPPPRDETF